MKRLDVRVKIKTKIILEMLKKICIDRYSITFSM